MSFQTPPTPVSSPATSTSSKSTSSSSSSFQSSTGTVSPSASPRSTAPLSQDDFFKSIGSLIVNGPTKAKKPARLFQDPNGFPSNKVVFSEFDWEKKTWAPSLRDPPPGSYPRPWHW
ncbi:unnamed protein product [Cyclocybe aegerita]|uniref:Uncharacterized protein n=1 Tax=Cyclocybe aegerita TaxID=1973307 RepID=A0A8S0XN91_CYCAE|nr:unnamed protein product [Cyclocybe aegerita]